MDTSAWTRKLYMPMYNFFGGNEVLMGIFGTYLVSAFWFWATNAFLLYTDITGKPLWLSRYKVQQNQAFPIDKAKLWKAIKRAAYHTLYINLVYGPFLYWQQWMVGVSFDPNETPGLFQIIPQFAFFAIVQEIVFYYSHRLFHHPAIYQRVHKKHHEWTAPIGVVAIYTSTTEYLAGNGLSVVAGPLLMRAHIITFWMWLSLGLFVTVIHHSGYHLPYLPSNEFHDYHHLTFKENFGTLGLLDWLHGTDTTFRKTIQYKRHRMLRGFRPIYLRIKETITGRQLGKGVQGSVDVGTRVDSQNGMQGMNGKSEINGTQEMNGKQELNVKQ